MPRMVRSIGVVLLLVVAVSLRAQDGAHAHAFAVVTDASGAPVTGLSASDFVVRVDGRDVPVTAAAPATAPISLVFLTSGISQELALETRRTMEAVLATLAAQSPQSRVGLMLEQGGAAPIMHGVLDADGALKKSISRFIGSHDTSPLLEGIIAAARTLRTEPTSRRVILALSLGTESQVDVASPGAVIKALRDAGASLWSLDFGWSTRMGLSEERALADGTRLSGGRRDLFRPASMQSRITRLVETVLSQYQVSFALPAGLPDNASLRLGVRRDEGTVLAPTWVATK